MLTLMLIRLRVKYFYWRLITWKIGDLVGNNILKYVYQWTKQGFFMDTEWVIRGKEHDKL
jgi:hypothetical protein